MINKKERNPRDIAPGNDPNPEKFPRHRGGLSFEDARKAFLNMWMKLAPECLDDESLAEYEKLKREKR